jgi:hypothetical protein
VFLFFFARYFFHNKLIVKIRQTSRKLTCALHICSFSTEIKKVPAVISALQFRRQTQAWGTRQSNVTDKIMTSFQRNSYSRCACYICAWAQPQRWVDFVHRVHPLTLLLWPSTSAALPPSLSSSSVLLVLLTVDVLALPLALSSLKLSPFAALVPCPLLSLSLSLSPPPVPRCAPRLVLLRQDPGTRRGSESDCSWFWAATLGGRLPGR